MLVGAFLLFSFVTIVEGIGCQDDWVGHADSCYLYIGTKEPWVQAGRVCATHQSTLAAIETPEENLFIRGYLKVFAAAGADMTVWIGGHDMDIEDIWKWSPGGELVNYTDWYPRQPDGDGDCMNMYRGDNYHWNDAVCTVNLAFLCEKPKGDEPIIG